MNTCVLEKAKEQANILLNAGPSCKEIKEAAQNWLNAIGTDKEKEMAKALIAEAEEDVVSIEDMIAFFESERAAGWFGKEKAQAEAEAGKKAKTAGAKYCTCDACAACCALIEMKEALLG